MTEKFLARDPDEEFSKVSLPPLCPRRFAVSVTMCRLLHQAFRLFDDDGTGKISLKVCAEPCGGGVVVACTDGAVCIAASTQNLRRISRELGENFGDDELRVCVVRRARVSMHPQELVANVLLLLWVCACVCCASL